MPNQAEIVSKQLWVIEDDDPIASCLQMLLQEAGYRVDIAPSLEDARLLESIPELILLDYLLPDGNGIAFLPELGRRFPTVPVILLTARERVGLSSFPNHVTYLPKPFRNRELLEVVRAQFFKPAVPQIVHRH